MRKSVFICISLFFSGITFAQPPVFDWASQMGDTSGTIIILSTAADNSGNFYAAGIITGTVDVAPGTAVAMKTDAGFGDIFISKVDSSGNFLWARQIGRESYDQCTSMALDAAGNVYMTGFFSMDSTDFDPGPGTFYLPNPSGGALTYLLKLDAAGNFQWAWELAPGSNSPSSITLDGSGNILVTGIFGDSVDFDPGAGTAFLASITNDIFISKFDASGNYIWAKQINTTTTGSRSASVATDAANNVYISGLLLGTVDFEPGTGIFNLMATSAFGAEYILKLDSSGSFAWARVIDGSLSQSGGDRAVLADASGNTYTLGWFGNTVDFDPNAGVFNMTNTTVSGGSTYLLKLDSSGNLAWAKQIGDPGNGNFKAQALDAEGNLYLTGTIRSTGDFDPGTGTYTLSPLNGSSFLAKYDTTGNLDWAVNFSNDTASSDLAIAVQVDPTGNIFTMGAFHHTGDFDPGPGVFPLTSVTVEDIFVLRMHGSTVTSVHDIPIHQTDWLVYPNPSRGTIRIQTIAAGTYTIVNASGNVTHTFAIKQNESPTVTIPGLPGGIYLVVHWHDGTMECKKIVVQ